MNSDLSHCFSKFLLLALLFITGIPLWGQNMQSHTICRGDTLGVKIGAFDSILSFSPADLDYQIKDDLIYFAPTADVDVNIAKELDDVHSAYLIKVKVIDLKEPKLNITNQILGTPICIGSSTYINIDPRSTNLQTVHFSWKSNLELRDTVGAFNDCTMEQYNEFVITSSEEMCSRTDTTILDFTDFVPAPNIEDRTQCYGQSVSLFLNNPVDYNFVKWTSQNNSLSCRFCTTSQVDFKQNDTIRIEASFQGCNYRKEIPVLVTEPLEFSVSDEICPGEKVTISLSNTELFDSINWVNLQSEDCPTGVNCSEQSFFPDTDTIITVETSLESSRCLSSYDIPVVVKPGPPRASFEYFYPQKCPDKPLRVRLSNAREYTTWSWNDPHGLSCTVCTIFDVDNKQDSTFYISLSKQGCSRVDSLVIDVESKPQIDFTAGVCLGETAYIDLGDPSLYDEIIWSPRYNCGSPLCTEWQGLVDADTTTYLYRQTTNLCEYNDTIRIGTIDPEIKLQILDDSTTYYIGTKPTFTVVYDTDLPSREFIWTINDKEVCKSQDTCEIVLDQTDNKITVSLPFIDACNAAPYAEYEIFATTTEISSSKIPTLLTPSAGKNNRLKPYIDIPYTFERFDIYNRWGKKVASVTNPEGWDGTIEGSLASEDIYRYVMKIRTETAEKYTFSGEVMLIH